MRRWSGRVAATAVLAVLGLLAPGTSPASAEGPQRTVTYEVRSRGPVAADLGAFARVAAATFNDRRGWSAGGSTAFREVPSGGELTLWLAAPSAMTSFSSTCSAQYSCRVGRHVVINDERWRTGTPSWPAVREYRRYVLNHELGHWFGAGHTGCSAPGAPAPVMMQQSKGLGGCRSTTWPLPAERRAAAAQAGVALRPLHPDVVAVDLAAPTGAEVHVLPGAADHATRTLRAVTPLRPLPGDAWDLSVADHDRDGVGDLYAVRTRGGTSTELTVLSGASGYRTPLLSTGTALHPTDGTSWSFSVADADGDGHQDLYALNSQGASGTEVHVLDGASGYRSWQLHAATALHRTAPGAWDLSVGDHDRDGVPDVYAVARRGGSGRTELHVLSGAGGFRSWGAHAVTPLGPTPRSAWAFDVGDRDGDGHDDLAAVALSGASGRAEVHVLAHTGTTWLLHAATPLSASPGWSFELA